jgi:plasmid stability protein
MTSASKRSTIYLDHDIHRALRLKAAETGATISDLVNEALRQSLAEDQSDLADFEQRAAEPTMTYEALLNDLKANGKI